MCVLSQAVTQVITVHIQQPYMQVFYYLFLATPAPVPTIFDYYVLRPLYDVIGPQFRASQFVLRDRLGGGNFGITYEAVKKQSACYYIMHTHQRIR